MGNVLKEPLDAICRGLVDIFSIGYCILIGKIFKKEINLGNKTSKKKKESRRPKGDFKSSMTAFFKFTEYMSICELEDTEISCAFKKQSCDTELRLGHDKINF